MSCENERNVLQLTVGQTQVQDTPPNPVEESQGRSTQEEPNMESTPKSTNIAVPYIASGLRKKPKQMD